MVYNSLITDSQGSQLLRNTTNNIDWSFERENNYFRNKTIQPFKYETPRKVISNFDCRLDYIGNTTIPNKNKEFGVWEEDHLKTVKCDNLKVKAFKKNTILNFCSSNNKITKSNNSVKLLNFLRERIFNTFTKKNFEVSEFSCKLCGVVYQSACALGGHMSKNHPVLSPKYRIEGSNIEKNRKFYFKYLRNPNN